MQSTRTQHSNYNRIEGMEYSESKFCCVLCGKEVLCIHALDHVPVCYYNVEISLGMCPRCTCNTCKGTRTHPGDKLQENHPLSQLQPALSPLLGATTPQKTKRRNRVLSRISFTSPVIESAPTSQHLINGQISQPQKSAEQTVLEDSFSEIRRAKAMISELVQEDINNALDK